MKTGLLQILYANPSASLNHESRYTHLTKLYKLSGTLGAPKEEEDVVFMQLNCLSL